ncbi:hypothetical protein [Blastococcus sp. CT_GayMR16]|uniref:hypothetical protein n=1 Tax=Blastococcus sp. CT_GayMR16 TaxID=2559607 RepID=UPI001074622D|nr:hypothetical protein [Blastococcus sp. CT_GayMR16]TFV90376.1 hypothetical protein E4P38_02750 [Blastococcus sp. CT_GayMR16]
MRSTAIGSAVVLLLSACGGASADDLTSYLSDHYEGVGEYRALRNGEISIEGGNVEVRLGEDGTETAAMDYCGWIGEWLYDEGNGEPSSDIVIVDETGRVLSQRGSDRAACSFGAG